MPRSAGAASSATSPASANKNWLKTGIDPMLAHALEELTDLLITEPVEILPCLRDAKSDKYLFKNEGGAACGDADDIPFHKTYKKLQGAEGLPPHIPRAFGDGQRAGRLGRRLAAGCGKGVRGFYPRRLRLHS